jgi:sulfatase maturation enzyme AslB (radical SAM superfamily)
VTSCTSTFIRGLHIVVSIDGLQPEHDARRSPATYERILKNIAGHRITVHCTITRPQIQRPGYLADFADFKSNCKQVDSIGSACLRLKKENKARSGLLLVIVRW